MGYLFWVGSNILLSMVVQQCVVIFEFSQEKMSIHPSTLPSCVISTFVTQGSVCQAKQPSCTVPLSSENSYIQASNFLYSMLKLLQSCFNSTCTMSFQMFTLDLEKAEEPEFKLPTFAGSLKMQESTRVLLYWLCQSLWLCGSQQTVENF